MYKNGLIRKIRLILKFMTSQPGQQTIAIHILPSISRRKGNQTMKSGQLIEYNMRNIFLEKSYTKCGGKIIPRPFSEKSKLSILWINSLKFYTACFYCMLILLPFTLYKAFLKNKKRSGTSLLASFSA